ncbi:MAG: tripartite tricarboxylate transporter substrate binding protein [Betaproteobacteria bacterium]|nr:tripartite tricarboxylate transporter substrate binding protein [Betaproteobacteria bacterium]
MHRLKLGRPSHRIIVPLFLAWVAWLAAAPTVAQDYPAKPVRVVVANTTGSLGDIISRVLFAKASESFGEQFLIDNRPGAGGAIGAAFVAGASPDGYTLLLGSDSIMTIGPHLHSKLGYDTLRDFAAVTMVAKVPFGIVAHPSVGVKSMDDFLRLAKARPGQINYSSGGNGHGTHVNMAMLQWKAGIQLVHVPYKGTGPALQAVISGEVSAAAMGLGSVLPHIQSGKVVALAIGGPRARDVLPNVPDLGKLVPDSEYISWQAVFAPAGTPRQVVEKLNATLATAMAAPEVMKRMVSIGMTAVGSTAAELEQTVRREFSVNGELVKLMGLKVE